MDPVLSQSEGLLFFRNRWSVPERKDFCQEIFSQNNNNRIAGQFGQFKSADKVNANIYWTNMDQHIQEYVQSCNNCQRNKTERHTKYGEKQPLEVPCNPGTSISMDFIVGLPESGGYTKIWVIVDRFSVIAHFVPLPSVNKTEDMAKLFLA
jgi:hypothetical protein